MNTILANDIYDSRSAHSGGLRGRSASVSSPPCDKPHFPNCDGLQSPVALPVMSLPAKACLEPQYSDDTTLHYAPSGDLTACASWHNYTSLTVPNIVKISLLPVVSPRRATFLAPSCSDTPVSLFGAKPSATFPRASLPNNTSQSLDRLTWRNRDYASNLSTASSRRTVDPGSTECPSSVNIVWSPGMKSSISLTSLTEDWEPVLDMTFSTPSIAHRSIVSYDIVGTLGRGTYGKVLLAYLKQRPDGDLYAVKMVPKTQLVQYSKIALAGELNTLQIVANASSLEFNGEDSIHSSLFLQHLEDYFQDDKFHFIVLEYHPTTLSESETASRFLIQEFEQAVAISASMSLPLADKSRRFPLVSYEEAISAVRLLTAEISLGLLFLHRNSIVHQDIKPANIMISTAGHAVIGDFGAASKLPSLESSSFQAHIHTSSSHHCRAIVLQPDDFITFTPLYAAPELRERNLDGLVVYDERADWWSLGILLYELVTGGIPFDSTSGPDTLKRLRRSDGDHSLSFGHLERLSLSWSAHGDCCAQLQSFLRSLLLHTPNDRLCGQDVLRHHFFDPVQTLWDEIVALKHPPCPNPPISRVDNDVSLNFDSSFETQSEAELVNGAQPLHGDNSIQSINLFNQRELTIDEAVRDPIQWNCTAKSDTSNSLIQAMPSSASIWFPSVDSLADNSGTCNVNSSALHISLDTYNLVRGSVTIDRFFTTAWASTPQPRLSDTLYQNLPRHQYHSPYCAVAFPTDPVLPEEITMSLLDAMDTRDHQEIMVRVEKQQQQRPKRTISSARKIIKATAQWTWRKLHFW